MRRRGVGPGRGFPSPSASSTASRANKLSQFPIFPSPGQSAQEPGWRKVWETVKSSRNLISRRGTQVLTPTVTHACGPRRGRQGSGAAWTSRPCHKTGRVCLGEVSTGLAFSLSVPLLLPSAHTGLKQHRGSSLWSSPSGPLLRHLPGEQQLQPGGTS